MRPPINSQKHYIQVSLGTVLAGASNAIQIARGVEGPSANSGDEVREGAIVKAVFVEMWVKAQDTANGSTLVTLVKSPNDITPTFGEMINLNDYTNKKNIFYHTQGITNDQDSIATPFVRQWFKIPKGKQRFGKGDRLFLVISAQALDNTICGFMTYKEYF